MTLRTTREQVIKAGLAVIIADAHHTELLPGDRVYVLEFKATGPVWLIQSGEYRYSISSATDQAVRIGAFKQSLLVFFMWDGETEVSKYPASRRGMTTEPSNLVVVRSLDGIGWEERRPHLQRQNHPLEPPKVA